MRQGRIKAPAGHPVGYYHCLSRVVDRRFFLGPAEKEHFTALMREYEAFCGVRVLTFCVMSNHFHIVVAVPRRPEVLPPDEELLQAIERLSGTASGGQVRQQLERFRQEGHHDAAEALRQRFFARMWDLSAFMKLLKQRFTQWFNRSRGRKGTLWEERFKSVLVEGLGDTLATMAAYVDLNPVRAGLVEDPALYRWCGYGQAMGGIKRARFGLAKVVAGSLPVPVEQLDPDQALPLYRQWLFGQGEMLEGTSPEGRPLRRGLSTQAVSELIAAKGRVPITDYLRLKVRYFSDGAILGSKGFVNEVFTCLRRRFGARRRHGARRMRGVASEGLFVLRDLRLNVFSAPAQGPPLEGG